jgi:hypothetical protein
MEKREVLINEYRELLRTLYSLRGEVEVKELELREIERKLQYPQEMRY